MTNPLAFIGEVSAAQRRTLLAAALGWMLDAFDVMLYSLVVAHIMTDLQMSKQSAGFLNTLTLLASGIGGVLFSGPEGHTSGSNDRLARPIAIQSSRLNSQRTQPEFEPGHAVTTPQHTDAILINLTLRQ